MLKKFEVKNFKNFKEDITIDFAKIGGYQFSTDCITDNLISKMLIYGKNATGKTNLGEAIMDIRYNLLGLRRFHEKFFVNADSNDNYSEFEYTFKFGEEEVIYRYSKFSNVDLRDEELSINEEKIFYCNFSEKEYSFENLNYVSAESVVLDRYLDSIKDEGSSEDITEHSLPFMRWLINNSALADNSVLLKIYDYVRGMSMSTVGGMVMSGPRRMYDNFFEVLYNEKNQLKQFEKFLNIMGIKCSLSIKKLPDDQHELYFKYKKLIPFYENASSGTRALLNFYRRFFNGKTASMIYLDEFDAFYHFEMAENLLKFFKNNFPNCQIILTSHNTNLISNRLLRPDCIFILSRTGQLTSLSNATQRELREGHNLEKMYISGEFDEYE